MRTILPLALILVWSAACASPDSRIRRHKAAFDSYPAAVQAKIRAGEVDVGFTREQAEMALGAPDRKYTRKTASGAQDVWAYGRGSSRPRMGLSFGMGLGRGERGGSYSGGMGVESEANRDERARVVFQDDRLVSVEELQK